MKIYIINLASSIDRRELQQKQLKNLGLEYEIFNAITGDDISKKTYNKHYKDWQRPLKKSEFGCYFSHQTIWKKLIKDNRPALILEDDILLSKHTPRLIKQFNNYTKFDLINLEVCFRKKYVDKYFKKTNNTHQLIKLYLNRSGAGAYILYPSGAKKLLQHKKNKGIALADYHIHNCYDLKSYQVEPALATQMIFATRYKIKTSYPKIFLTGIFAENRTKSNYLFKYKRIIGQLRLGIRLIAVAGVIKKRNILLNPADFNI